MLKVMSKKLIRKSIEMVRKLAEEEDDDEDDDDNEDDYEEMDEMDEDEGSTRNFDRVLVATVEITGRAPNPACARAVFDKICDQCEDHGMMSRQVENHTVQHTNKAPLGNRIQR